MKDIIKLIRVQQWIKNLLIFAPLFFSFQLFVKENLINSIIVFFCFSFAASFIYIINDILDIEKDKLHYRKKNRPLPSGRLNKKTAYLISIVIIVICILLQLYLNKVELYLVIFSYIILNILYSFYLKNISIIDAICIAIGFELRILAGCFTIAVTASDFILLVTFFLALMLAFIKRKGELNMLDDSSNKHREVLKNYTPALLDKFIFSTASITIIGYMFYTIDDNVINNIGNDYLKYSLVFVVYGIFRFIQLTEINMYNKEGDPTTLIYKDRPIQISLLLWMIYVAICLYVS